MSQQRSPEGCFGRRLCVFRVRGVRTIVSVGFGVILAVCLGSCASSDVASTASIISIADSEFHWPVQLLSEVSASNPLEHAFSVENVSSGPIRVTVKSVSCGCMGLRLGKAGRALKAGDDFPLRAGETEELIVGVRVAAKPETQTYNARFLAQRDGGEEEPFEVGVLVPVRPDVLVSPPAIAHRFSSSDPVKIERKLRIECTTRCKEPRKVEPRFVVVPPEVEVVGILARECRQIEPSLWVQAWEARLTLGMGDCQQSIISDNLVMSLEDSKVWMAPIPVTIRRVFGVEVAPTKVDFGRLSLGEERERRVLLSASDDRTFEITSVSSELPEVSASVAFRRTGKRHWSSFKFAPTSVGEFRGRIAVCTTHPDAPELAVEVCGICQ